MHISIFIYLNSYIGIHIFYMYAYINFFLYVAKIMYICVRFFKYHNIPISLFSLLFIVLMFPKISYFK